jgi:hypothetical protein
MSPTTTEGLPPLIARASGAWIWAMSHCRPERLSLPGAGSGVTGSDAVAASAALRASATPKDAVAAAASTDASAERRREEKSVADDETSATPMLA